MTPAWAQRQAELLSDCIVSPDVFHHMVDRLRDFAIPYQHALETEASQRNVHLYLAGLLPHLDRKNAETIAALVDVERLVMQEFIGTAPDYHKIMGICREIRLPDICMCAIRCYRNTAWQFIEKR